MVSEDPQSRCVELKKSRQEYIRPRRPVNGPRARSAKLTSVFPRKAGDVRRGIVRENDPRANLQVRFLDDSHLFVGQSKNGTQLFS